MKLIILVACALVAVAIAAPPTSEPAKILRSEYEQTPGGGFVSSFESEDGTVREEVGELKEVRNEEGDIVRVLVVRGSYSYFDSEGIRQTITYVADEEGYRAQGNTIPVARR